MIFRSFFPSNTILLYDVFYGFIAHNWRDREQADFSKIQTK